MVLLADAKSIKIMHDPFFLFSTFNSSIKSYMLILVPHPGNQFDWHS